MATAMAIGAGLEGIGSILGMGAATEAERRRLQLMRNLARPGIKARGFLAGLMGKESPILAKQYELGAGKLTRLGQSQKRRARLYFGRNIGRARGEQMRIERAVQEAQNQLALGYAGQQTEYGLRPAYALAGQGTGGLEAAIMGQGQARVEGISNFNAAIQSYLGWQQMAGMFGNENPAPRRTRPFDPELEDYTLPRR